MGFGILPFLSLIHPVWVVQFSSFYRLCRTSKSLLRPRYFSVFQCRKKLSENNIPVVVVGKDAIDNKLIDYLKKEVTGKTDERVFNELERKKSVSNSLENFIKIIIIGIKIIIFKLKWLIKPVFIVIMYLNFPVHGASTLNKVIPHMYCLRHTILHF